MTSGPALTLASVTLQSVGKVLYGTFLVSVSTPLFVIVSMTLTAAVFLAGARFRMPRDGRWLLVLTNIWTAISFISIFYALKHLPPALFACIEIGMSLVTALALISIQNRAWPQTLRIVACTGILGGCALLSWVEVEASTTGASGFLIWTAIGASSATGIASALSASASRKLALKGWSPPTVLAHRFYLTIAVAALWLVLDPPAQLMPSAHSLAVMALVGTVGVLVPLLFLQIALRRADELTVMICMAAQPMLSFLIAVPSPVYEWSTLTLIGVIVVTAFVGLDIATQRSAAPAPGAAPAAQPTAA